MSKRAWLFAIWLIASVFYPPLITVGAAVIISGLLIYAFFWLVIQFDKQMPKFESDPHNY